MNDENNDFTTLDELVTCPDCKNHHGAALLVGYIPPTPAQTLEDMHRKCMELEEDIQSIILMGGLEEYEDDLQTDIEALTFKVQDIIENI